MHYTVKSDAAGLAPALELLHGAGLTHEHLQLVEPTVGTAHHGVELGDGDHLEHLRSGKRRKMPRENVISCNRGCGGKYIYARAGCIQGELGMGKGSKWTLEMVNYGLESRLQTLD